MDVFVEEGMMMTVTSIGWCDSFSGNWWQGAFPQCVNVVWLMIVQCGGENYLICLKDWTEWWGDGLKNATKNCRNCLTVAVTVGNVGTI